MAMGEDGIPIVFEDKCTACGKCVEACPRYIIELHPATEDALVFCRSHDRGPVAKKVCDNACIACKICARDFPDAIVMDNFLAKVVDESKIPRERLSDLDKCPTGAIGRIKRVYRDR
jgi:Na+-translocating ferredoxin:NAD+ oxidoreductase RNF subunit RnfB